MPFRPQAEFAGRGAKCRLSSHTIASFMALQNVASPEALGEHTQMNLRLLQGLLRRRAMQWWMNDGGTERPGEPAWLTIAGDAGYLTRSGLLKIRHRLRREERTSDGRRSPYNVSSADVQRALELVLHGPSSSLGADTELEEIPW